MWKTVEAILEKDGRLRLAEQIPLKQPKRVLVTFVDTHDETEDPMEISVLSEAALGQDWHRQEEDDAWQHLQ